MIIIGEKINGAIPSIKQAIAERNEALIIERTLAQAAAAPAAAAGGSYVPGTYTAEAAGMGTVKVSVTVDENAITEVVLDTAGETPEIGGAATEELTNQVMAAQGSAIDGVSGATITSDAARKAVADAAASASMHTKPRSIK